MLVGGGRLILAGVVGGSRLILAGGGRLILDRGGWLTFSMLGS